MSGLYKIPRTDLRQYRADSMAATIMAELEDVLGQDADLKEIHHRLVSLFYINGFAWTTEEERTALGFEPRDTVGWTASERVRDREARKAAMLEIMQPTKFSEAVMNTLKEIEDDIRKTTGISDIPK